MLGSCLIGLSRCEDQSKFEFKFRISNFDGLSLSMVGSGPALTHASTVDAVAVAVAVAVAKTLLRLLLLLNGSWARINWLLGSLPLPVVVAVVDAVVDAVVLLSPC